MRILTVHNRYQHPGGEDEVFERESALLRERGNEVLSYVRSNAEIAHISYMATPVAQANAMWSSQSYRELSGILADFLPDVAHFHNTFARISPSAYYACRRAGVPVVQSLHNSRLICPSANLTRNGTACELCVGQKFAWPGIRLKCYRGSSLRTAGVALVSGLHRAIGTWDRYIDRYIVFSEFYWRKFVEAGFPPEKMAIKPHFLHPDPGPRRAEGGEYALSVGRLGPEKGIETLMTAWKSLPEVPLVVRGDGPLWQEMEASIAAGELPSVRMVGRLSAEGLLDLMKGAKYLIWPSLGYYETFGLVAMEAFACGVPVIASATGVATELIEDGKNGLYFEAGNAADLIQKVKWAEAHPEEMAARGRRARQTFERNYTAAKNYDALISIYRGVMSPVRAREMR